MRSLHLTLMIFGQVLLASFILYSAVTSASPLNQPGVLPESPALKSYQKVDVVAQVTDKQPEAKLAPIVPVAQQLSNIVVEAVKPKEKVAETISARSIKEPVVTKPVVAEHVAPSAVAVPKEKEVEQVVPREAPKESVQQPEVKSEQKPAQLEAKSAVEPAVALVAQELASPQYSGYGNGAYGGYGNSGYGNGGYGNGGYGNGGYGNGGRPQIGRPIQNVVAVVSPGAGVITVPIGPTRPTYPYAGGLEARESPVAAQEPAGDAKSAQQTLSARLINLPEAGSVKAPEESKIEARSALDEFIHKAKEVPAEVSSKDQAVKEIGAEAARKEQVAEQKSLKELVGKSLVEEQPVAPQASRIQVEAKQPEVHQAPVAEKVPEPVVGVVEPVKRAEPVSASVLLVVQSPEPKITVVSKSDQQLDQQQQIQSEAKSVVTKVQSAEASPVAAVAPSTSADSEASSVSSPIVNGGLGPLHLLATTLCSYQPDKPVADDTLNSLYTQRAAVRKSLFDFMSLKFTNLEKFSSRLNAGLEIMPRKTAEPGVVPSHGWPVVGKCTAHDLKLMAEAAWCETPAAALDKETPKITSNQHRIQSARALEESQAIADQSAVISKILHVSDIKDAPIVESSIANLNLTQQQLADIQAQATSTRACRRNALKLTKSLFNHLAEEQKNVSETWPQLYAQMAGDDCARKRMIDIVNALSGFRTDSTSIRRDNVEFAFAMDDLRSKVLESEVNVPLTFDKQFIEVEQFLQQSVKLMLANIDPERAKLTSMRYRSLMPGPLSADDQCIELHQRLLAKNYPTDCNPTQFGQLPDVLRMAASSLELWSIENELSKRSGKVQEYPSTSQTVRQDVNQCIANLVAS